MKKTFRKISQAGFSLAEMIVVLAIFAIITTVVILNYGKFNSQTIMTNMAYELALAARQAQVYSLGVRGQAGSDDFDNRYGVYVNIDQVLGDTDETKQFVFFVDLPEGDNMCDAGDGSSCYACTDGECLELYTLSRDIYIDKICIGSVPSPVDQSGECADDDYVSSSATVVFSRPNPEAIVNGDTDQNVAIVLKNSFGDQRAVLIRSTGQISVDVLDNAL